MSCGEHEKAAKTEHTQEPWSYGEDNDGWYVEKDGLQIAHGLTEEDARRIVACVNACAGLPTEVLERYKLGVIGVDYKLTKQQRDELLAAAEAIEIDAEECLDFDECTAMLVPIDTYHKLMEAIVSVKGGAA